MINQLTNEIYRALDAELYLVALCTALTLPDICGKAELPNETSTAKRYKMWYEKHIGQFEKSPDDNNNDMPYLSADVVYDLRCSLLHQGNPNVNQQKTNIDRFELIIQRFDGLEICFDSSTVITHADGTSTRIIKVNIKSLCWKLCDAAKIFFEKYKDKFTFFDYKIVDMNKIFPFTFPV